RHQVLERSHDIRGRRGGSRETRLTRGARDQRPSAQPLVQEHGLTDLHCWHCSSSPTHVLCAASVGRCITFLYMSFVYSRLIRHSAPCVFRNDMAAAKRRPERVRGGDAFVATLSDGDIRMFGAPATLHALRSSSSDSALDNERLLTLRAFGLRIPEGR